MLGKMKTESSRELKTKMDEGEKKEEKQQIRHGDKFRAYEEM